MLFLPSELDFNDKKTCVIISHVMNELNDIKVLFKNHTAVSEKESRRSGTGCPHPGPLGGFQLMDNGLQPHTGEQAPIHGRKGGANGGLVIKKSESRTEFRRDFFPPINHLNVPVLQ